ncbi:MAG: AMP-binding protein [Breznakibacter sp.]
MKNRFQSLIFDGVSYSREELLGSVVPSLIQSKEAWRHSIGEFIAQWLDETDSMQVKTSGSTGEPKLISVSKEAMVLSAQKTIRFFGLEPGTRALLCLPASYIAGRMMLVRAFVGQWDLHFVQPNNLFEALGDDSVYDMAALVPLQLEQLLAAGFDFSRIKTIIVGGAPCSNALRQSLAGSNIWETYGMTETVSHIALRKIGEAWFYPLQDVFLSVEARGCLCIDAPGITHCRLVTNDVVELQPDGRFRFLGRADHVINSGGIKHFPEELEIKLAGCFSVPYFLIGLPDASLGEKIVLVLEIDVVDEAGILEKLKTLLDKYEIPKAVMALNPFPHTGNGKIDRPAIRRCLLEKMG